MRCSIVGGGRGGGGGGEGGGGGGGDFQGGIGENHEIPKGENSDENRDENHDVSSVDMSLSPVTEESEDDAEDEEDMAILEDINSPEVKKEESGPMTANDFFDTMSNSTLVVHAPRGNNRGRGRGDYRGG